MPPNQLIRQLRYPRLSNPPPRSNIANRSAHFSQTATSAPPAASSAHPPQSAYKSPPNLRHNIRLNALPRLIQYQQPGLEHQCPADGQLLLLATGQVAASAVFHFFQHRRQLIHPLGKFCCRLVLP